ncbi:MAG: transcriptional regulator, ArsR family [Thermoplasmatales archaeon]|nr:transcriptional regulator, ArsR family [Thermoplasmatales archaeon]
MTKITLDRETFKALASDTRLDILKTLDGKNMGLNEIAKVTNLNKATLHEHLTKLHEAGLIKRNERDGHKWVYYKLTWKGESLLHPENTKIVVLFATTIIALWVGLIQLIWYIKGTVTNFGYDVYNVGDKVILKSQELTDGAFPLLGGNWPASASFPPGYPDFLLRAKLGLSQWIPLGKDITVITENTDTNGLTAGEGGRFVIDQSQGVIQAVYQNPVFLYAAIGCFVAFSVLLVFGLWRFWENRAVKI